MKQRQALANVTGARYRKAGKTEKGVIPNGFCHSAGYNRKRAVTLLVNAGKTQTRRLNGKTVKVNITAATRGKRRYTPCYGEDAGRAVLAVWNFFRRACGKRLVPMTRENLGTLFADKRLNLSPQAKAKTAQASRSTAGRTLKKERARHTAKGTCGTKPGTLLKQRIPVRTFRHGDGKKPGFAEAGANSMRSILPGAGSATKMTTPVPDRKTAVSRVKPSALAVFRGIRPCPPSAPSAP